MSTRIVNIKDGSHYDVYIGRGGRGYDGYFGNPYSLAACDWDRDLCLLKYKEYFYKRLADDPEFKRRVLALRDQTLGCFCRPAICHGDVIADYLDNQR